MTRLAQWRSDERGSVATEFAIVMAAVLLGFVALTIYGGRVVQAENDVRSAAQEAARAASLEGTPAAADAAARSVAVANLSRSGVSCPTPVVAVDLARFGPGGDVTVTITCTASFGDVGSLGVADSRAFTASATEVIDRYRGGA
ncbi:MAG: TadE/TadG family type IV pilus assembly protein [Acidimicrobiales bacterium]